MTTGYLILNGDGLVVAGYELLSHAIESARENAAQAAREGDDSNFYSVTRADFSAPDTDEQYEFTAAEFTIH